MGAAAERNQGCFRTCELVRIRLVKPPSLISEVNLASLNRRVQMNAAVLWHFPNVLLAPTTENVKAKCFTLALF